MIEKLATAIAIEHKLSKFNFSICHLCGMVSKRCYPMIFWAHGFVKSHSLSTISRYIKSNSASIIIGIVTISITDIFYCRRPAVFNRNTKKIMFITKFDMTKKT